MMCCALLGFGAFLAMLITTLNVVVAAGDLTVDACVFDEFAPGDFELRDSGTIQRSTLRRYPQSLSRHTSWSRCALLPTGESRDARRATVSPVTSIRCKRGDLPTQRGLAHHQRRLCCALRTTGDASACRCCQRPSPTRAIKPESRSASSKRIDSLLSALRAALPEMHRAMPFVTCARVQSSF